MKNCAECETEIVESNDSYLDSALSLSKERIIFISEDFSDEMANNFSAILIAHANLNPEEEITLLIDSDGGATSALILILDVIDLMKVPIKTICLSRAFSAGAILLAAGTKGKRYALSNSMIMIHGLQCLYPYGGYDIKSADQYLDILNHHNNSVMQILAQNTNKTFEQVMEDCKKDLYLTPQEALDYGIIDKIIDDFNEIININESKISTEIRESEMAKENMRVDIIKELTLKCDAKCNSCPNSEHCEDLSRINKYLNNLSDDECGSESDSVVDSESE